VAAVGEWTKIEEALRLAHRVKGAIAAAIRPRDVLGPAPEPPPLPAPAPAPETLARFDRGDPGEEPIRRCAWCGVEVPEERRADARYCSERCGCRAREGRRSAR
jgi:hypothetical protein